MKVFPIFIFLLLISSGISNGNDELAASESTRVLRSSPKGTYRPALPDFSNKKSPLGRSLLSPSSKHETALVAALDGTVYLVETSSGKVHWSFSSGPSLSTSHQALPDQDDRSDEYEHGEKPRSKSHVSSSFFIDCGDDWNLYLHGKNVGKMKLPMSIEEYVFNTPQILEDGGVILGSKVTTIFRVDAKSGKIISQHQLVGILSNTQVERDKDKKDSSKQSMSDLIKVKTSEFDTVDPLYVTRTDYVLQSVAPNNKVLWNVSVSEIDAFYLCPMDKNAFGDTLHNISEKFDSEDPDKLQVPLPCQTKAVVYRTRDDKLLIFNYKKELENQDESGILPLPSSSNEGWRSDEHQLLVYNNPTQSIISSHKDDVVSNSHAKGQKSSLKEKLPVPMELSGTDNSDYSDISYKLKQNGYHSHMKVVDVNRPVDRRRSIVLEVVIWCLPLITFLVLLNYYYPLLKRLLTLMLKGRAGHDIFLQVPREIDKKTDEVRVKHNSATRRKKTRKIGSQKNNTLISIDRQPLFNTENSKSIRKESLFSNRKNEENGEGRWIGKLFVSQKEIAKGSNGTVILEGSYEGRLVAIKRLVQTHHDVASKEIQNLIASDQHPNIVRWYGVEYDLDFVYLSLERCTCNLNVLVQTCTNSSSNSTSQTCPASDLIDVNVEQYARIDEITKDLKLWTEKGFPSPQLLKLMRDVVSGLAHLHELGIVHRDLKPQNVLIVKDKVLSAKLSDMGISKRLFGDMSTLSHHATGYGSSGWQAPEQLLHGRQTRAVDLFSLGCLLFFCITGGRHPFGDRLERDSNIVKGHFDLFLVDQIPEAVDLLTQLLNSDPQQRPKAVEVLQHPLFWSSEMRLSFLRDMSDRVELENRGETESELLIALESVALVALGGKWDEKMEPAFIANIGHYRRYKFDSTRDLLRVIRNKLNHYRELPIEIQEILGSVPQGFDSYFTNRFPNLLIEVYKVMQRFCGEEECFKKYFQGDLL